MRSVPTPKYILMFLLMLFAMSSCHSNVGYGRKHPKCLFALTFRTPHSHCRRGISGKKEPSGCSNNQRSLRQLQTNISSTTRAAKRLPSSTKLYPWLPVGIRNVLPCVCIHLTISGAIPNIQKELEHIYGPFMNAVDTRTNGIHSFYIW